MPGFAEEDLVEGEAFRPDAVSRDLGDSRGLGQHVGVNDRPHGPDFPFVGVPTISPAVFEAWLRARRSPALDEAPALAYYRAAMSKGINPGVALAFFHHESQCGGDTSIIPPGTRNWGNLRPRNDGSLGRGVRKVSTSVGVFRGYNSWLDGLLDWCDLWYLNIYKGKTITQALQIAPSGDGNNPHGYANTVLTLLKQWDQQSGDFDIPGDDSTPAPTPAPAPAPTLADIPLLGPPSIPVDTFTKTLSDAGSPVLQEADGADFFNLCVTAGVDPAVALAFFGQISQYGTAAGAADRKNWGNLWDPQANAVRTYSAWREGWPTGPTGCKARPTRRRARRPSPASSLSIAGRTRRTPTMPLTPTRSWPCRRVDQRPTRPRVSRRAPATSRPKRSPRAARAPARTVPTTRCGAAPRSARRCSPRCWNATRVPR